MKTILPCPFCGELPDTQKCGGAPDYYVCCEILAYSLEMWNKCSAAMTYAMAETERESFWSGGICSTPVYEFKGWTFEVPGWGGPWPLRRDGEPRKRAGDVFWRVWSEWFALPDDEKQKTRVGGGCVRF